MAAANNVLIVGGGIAGMSLAISLRRIGIAVELVELDPDWRVSGAGITIIAPTLRAFDRLGIVDRIIDEGSCTDGLKMCDARGRVMAELPTPSLAGPRVPGTGGILRPTLHRILSEATLAAGSKVRLGVTVGAMAQSDRHAHAAFTDGGGGDYDLIVGADGLFSALRRMIFPEAPAPHFTGQGCWRVVAPRPPEIAVAHMYMAGRVKAGVTPISRDEMYLFFLQHLPDNPRMPQERFHRILAQQLAPFGGAVGVIRDALGPDSPINYRPLEAILLPPPWHRGRVVLIGDAVHGTTPHLAAGAGMAVEDALVLTDLLAESDAIETALNRFAERRYPRAAMVVNNSLKLGEMEMSEATFPDYAALMGASMAALAAPM